MTWTTLPRSKLTSGLSGWQGGEGPPILLVHGVGLRAESWGAMIPELTPRFRVIAPDLPGHGESPLLAASPNDGVAPFTDQMAELLQRIDGPVLVVGHSLGALIALDLTINYSDKVAAAVPLNAIYRRSQAAANAVKARAAELAKSPNSDPSPTIERWFGIAPKGEMASMAGHCQNWLSTVNPEGYHRAYHVFAHEDGPTDEALRHIRQPVLFMTGADEPNSTPEMSHSMAELAPMGQSIVIKGARHMMPMTHASEVASHVADFYHNVGVGDA